MSAGGGIRVGAEGAVFDAFQRLLEDLERYLPLPPRFGPEASPALQSASIHASHAEMAVARSVEVTETATHVYITIDMSLQERDAVTFEAFENALVVRASRRSGTYEERVPLPAAVRAESLRATDRNGVIDVSIEKASSNRAEG